MSSGSAKEISNFRPKKRLQSATPILLLAPSLVIMAVFSVYPVFNAFRLSLYNKQLLVQGEQFIGLQNYVHLFQDPDFANSLKVTVLYVAGSVILQFVAGLLLATFLNVKGIKARTLFRTAYIVPYTLSELVVSLIWLQMLDPHFGVVNYFVSLFHVTSQNWLFKWALPTVTIVNCWWGTTFSLLMLEAAMKGIPHELYEAADVDGASSLKKFFFITMPSLKYASLLDLIMITLYTINSFGIIFVLTSGGPQGATDVIGMYMWRHAFQSMDLGLGAAISSFIFVANIIITFIYIRMFGLKTVQEGV